MTKENFSLEKHQESMTNTRSCPHCGAAVKVFRNGRKLCPDCGETFVVNGLPTKNRQPREEAKPDEGGQKTQETGAVRSIVEQKCPHCGATVSVFRNGKKLCPDCGETFVVSGLPTKSPSRIPTTSPGRRPSDEEIAPVQQPDGVSCGWATTLWLLRSFGFNPDPEALRRELNTDGISGIRGWLNRNIAPLAEKMGLNLRNAGTLPWTILAALNRRGLTLKNPIRLESPTEYEAYLHETINEGGRGIVLLWRLDGLQHWMGVDRKDGALRIMDPAVGAYLPFDTAIVRWKSAKGITLNFLVFGIVRK